MNQRDGRERRRIHEACKWRANDHPCEERGDWVAYPMPPFLFLTCKWVDPTGNRRSPRQELTGQVTRDCHAPAKSTPSTSNGTQELGKRKPSVTGKAMSWSSTNSFPSDSSTRKVHNVSLTLGGIIHCVRVEILRAAWMPSALSLSTWYLLPRVSWCMNDMAVATPGYMIHRTITQNRRRQ